MATDVKNDASLGANLQFAHFGSSESITTDLTGNGNTLTDNNTVGSTTSPNTGETAADFETSASEYFSIADNTYNSFTTNMSIAFWGTFESDGAWGVITKYGGAGQRSYFIEYSSVLNKFRYGIYNDGTNGTTYAMSNTWTPTLNQWYHFAFTFDGSAQEIKFYIDGSQQGTTQSTSQTTIHDGNALTYIGSFNTSQYWDGKMHQFLGYNKTLTSGDVSALYNSGTELPWDAGGGGSTFTPRAIFF